MIFLVSLGLALFKNGAIIGRVLADIAVDQQFDRCIRLR